MTGTSKRFGRIEVLHRLDTLMNGLASEGMAIMLITSELPELLALSDRIVVLHRGRLTATFNRQTATPERVLAAAMGTTMPDSA